MGRTGNNTMYKLAVETIQDMEVGDSKIIPMPEILGYFRKYLSERGKHEGKKFTTKVVGNKLHILRIKYSNIYSKEVE